MRYEKFLTTGQERIRLACALEGFFLTNECEEEKKTAYGQYLKRRIRPAMEALIWEENFNQKKSFDSQVWSKIPRGKSDWNNYMTDFDSCYAMRKGKLVLRGIVNHTQRNDTAPYLIGGVYTKGKKAFTNGRIEICAKLNAAGGAWPAIWMLPEGAAWPSGGEIDIMER